MKLPKSGPTLNLFLANLLWLWAAAGPEKNTVWNYVAGGIQLLLYFIVSWANKWSERRRAELDRLREGMGRLETVMHEER